MAEKGIDLALAREVAEQVSHDPEEALRLHAQEELGVDPEELPSPVVAAVSSFLSFALGAVIPLLSFLLGSHNLYLALAISAGALFALGAVVAKLTRGNVWYGALRQLLLATLAAGVTYAVGRAIGTSVS